MAGVRLSRYLGECRSLVADEIRRLIPTNRYGPVLYDLMLDYPLREGKAFRPALCIATSRAMGGRLQDVLSTAATLELYHNAFLLHDDVEDGSLMRRGSPTLHRDYGVPIAINVGDAMNALCLQPLLGNMSRLGLGKALRILDTVARMAQHSVEGQAVELMWIHRADWKVSDRDYCLMCYKKTCWYTFIAPMQIGALAAGADERQLRALKRYGAYVGLAFQIIDDVLNLEANEGEYGKETGGDLWEGKRTLILLHALRSAEPADRRRAQRILAKPRVRKREADVCFLLDLIQRHGSLDHARRVACRLGEKAQKIFQRDTSWMSQSRHRDFILGMASHVTERDR